MAFYAVSKIIFCPVLSYKIYFIVDIYTVTNIHSLGTESSSLPSQFLWNQPDHLKLIAQPGGESHEKSYRDRYISTYTCKEADAQIAIGSTGFQKFITHRKPRKLLLS